MDVMIETPSVGDCDLLVEVKGIGVNPVDYKIRSPKKHQVESKPRVLGWDAAGVVVDKGSLVKGFNVGDEVFYAGAINRPGANSQYHAADCRVTGRKPKSLDFVNLNGVSMKKNMLNLCLGVLVIFSSAQAISQQTAIESKQKTQQELVTKQLIGAPSIVQEIQSLVSNYFTLLYAQDMALFDKVFHKDTTLYNAQNGVISVLPIEKFREFLKHGKSAKENGSPREERIIMIDVLSPEMALAKVRLRINNDIFDDYLNLIKVDGRWLVVSKMWTKTSLVQ